MSKGTKKLLLLLLLIALIIIAYLTNFFGLLGPDFVPK
jgi:Flp pilus assembly pilin Flp